ncbi:MAG: hypothetical protein Hals2KO_19630 [Halioglobus sp.]
MKGEARRSFQALCDHAHCEHEQTQATGKHAGDDNTVMHAVYSQVRLAASLYCRYAGIAESRRLSPLLELDTKRRGVHCM